MTTTFAHMGVRYKLVATGKNRWSDGKVHIMFFRRENREWRLACRPNDPTGYFVHDLIVEQSITCKLCARHDPRQR